MYVHTHTLTCKHVTLIKLRTEAGICGSFQKEISLHDCHRINLIYTVFAIIIMKYCMSERYIHDTAV